ncbi:excinuclease ABC subunit UvrA [Anaerosporobacter faecicola]|uniref:excinuclease ABC subunit UvrA n=1 Tax=Anaerosporobacter faecicola TaxID=2718714 RepID=UPI00143BE97E|nr:excinuclease ABC subunit UvrA [Anaerosporobacter faecicola]
MKKNITIQNARIHNLQGVNVSIPKNKMTVITGVSGSGKSSLAFDTLYEEGKKRYLTFSGTQFMVEQEQSFDRIDGLSPTVAVEQRVIRQSNPRSTVGTRIKLEAMLAALLSNYGEKDPRYDDGKPLEIAMFQKNSPKGMCIKCMGAGSIYTVDEDQIFQDPEVTLENLFGGEQTHYCHLTYHFEKAYGVRSNRTLDSLSEEEMMLFKYGDGGKKRFLGVVPWLIQSYNYHRQKNRKNWITKLDCIQYKTCPKCKGMGISEQAAHTTFAGKNLVEMERMDIGELYEFLKQQEGNNTLLSQILLKLQCLIDVGLHHLSLSRKIPTLSGGEMQRLFLAAYIIAEMDSIIFIFDEPTIGLHEIEKKNLIHIIRKLVDSGNTVVAVEHDENFMREADYIIDMGPDAGIHGGQKIYEGDYAGFLSCKESRTAPYLTKEQGFNIKNTYRPVNPKQQLQITHANLHNLKDVNVTIPLGVMVGVAGVSGSGKSSLISDTLVPKLKEMLKTKFVSSGGESNERVEATLEGVEKIKRCYVIDQRPIGRTKTSCPATYIGIMDRVRILFAQTEEAKELGYTAGMFSVNSEGGCPTCKGEGVVHYYVGFGNFMDVTCEDCEGTGYVKEAMDVTLDGKNIREILQMSVDEAVEFFKDKDSKIEEMLAILQRVGMGYIKLGQATPTISGGESQRIKLAKELSKGSTAKGALYILDEPTTGLSFSDSEKLLLLMNELVDRGNSVIVTEHDPYILSNCDHLIEMGIGGGREGGEVIATGTPKELKENTKSIIGRYLKC